MSAPQEIKRYRTHSGKWLWQVGNGNRSLLLNDAELIELTKRMNETTGVIGNEQDGSN